MEYDPYLSVASYNYTVHLQYILRQHPRSQERKVCAWTSWMCEWTERQMKVVGIFIMLWKGRLSKSTSHLNTSGDILLRS